MLIPAQNMGRRRIPASPRNKKLKANFRGIMRCTATSSKNATGAVTSTGETITMFMPAIIAPGMTADGGARTTIGSYSLGAVPGTTTGTGTAATGFRPGAIIQYT